MARPDDSVLPEEEIQEPVRPRIPRPEGRVLRERIGVRADRGGGRAPGEGGDGRGVWGGNFVSLITIRTTTSEGAKSIGSTTDFVLWYARQYALAKYRRMFRPRSQEAERRYSQVDYDGREYRLDNITSSRPAGEGDVSSFESRGRSFAPGSGTFKTTQVGLERLSLADRVMISSRGGLSYRRYHDDYVSLVIFYAPSSRRFLLSLDGFINPTKRGSIQYSQNIPSSSV